MQHQTRHKGPWTFYWWEEKAYFTMVVFWLKWCHGWKIFMCAPPCTLNLLQVKCMGERKCHLQNLQQFQSKFEVEKRSME
jgi:hypothetical protein